MSKPTFVHYAAIVGAASALILLTVGAVAAAPVLSSSAEVKSAAPTAVIDARWRRRGWRRSYFIGSAYGYGRWRYGNSGCHIAGGYYRPNACW
jgi:hypothetical protein